MSAPATAATAAILAAVRVAIMTAGSRGDVAPFTGLGAGLVRAGHDVTLVTHRLFEPLIAGSGMRFHALPVDPMAELHSARGQGLHHSRTGPGKLLRVVNLARSLAGELADGLFEAAPGHDVLVLSPSVAPMGATIADALQLPTVGAYLQPLHPTREFSPPMLGLPPLGAWGNRAAGSAVDAAVDRVFGAASRDLRTRLGLPRCGVGPARRAREHAHWPVLYGFSPVVVPRPRDWRPGLDPVGYWWPFDARPLPDAVEDFLAAGPPPVFVGMGSATVPDPARFGTEVVRALRAAGLRGIVQQGWAEIRATGDDMLTVGDVPHHLLFPRTAAVVHHGGAGTTGAVLRAGVPTVPVPIQFDAGFWADRLVRLGVAPRAVPLRALTADRLAAALTAATGNLGYRTRARAVAARVTAEDGVGPVDTAIRKAVGALPA